MEKAKDLLTPLAEILLADKGMMDVVGKLRELAVLEFMDYGNELDAIDGLRDLFIYLAAKEREDKMKDNKKAGRR